MVNKKPELLSPAGSLDALVAAINAGCDAAYLGGKQFGARANATNFSNEELIEAIDLAHVHGVKLYYTMNTLVKEDELEGLLEQALFLYKNGIDAFIVQDIGVYKLLRHNFPDIDIHGSTQMTIHSLNGVRLLEELLFNRVVLSRELSLDEIKAIKNKSDMEIECFVHGALCYCYSGQCLMSSVIGGRSGNRGQCAQPCRLPYAAMENEQEINRETGRYLLSPKDIMTLEILPDLITSGIGSLKIEGRMKSSHYVAYVTAMYRKYIDHYFENKGAYKVNSEDINNMGKLYNRGGFSKGFYYQDDKMMSLEQPNHQGVRIGRVERLANKGQAKLAIEENLNFGDIIAIETKSDSPITYTVKETDKKNLFIPIKNKSVKVGNNVYKLKDTHLLSIIQKEIIEQPKKLEIRCRFTGKLGQQACIEVLYQDYHITRRGNVIEAAKTAATSKEAIKKQILKTGNYPVAIKEIALDIDENIFLPVSSINKLRREAVQALLDQITGPHKRDKASVSYERLDRQQVQKEIEINVSIKAYEQFKVISSYPIDNLYIDLVSLSNSEIESCVAYCKQNKIGVYLKLPSIVKRDKEGYLSNRLKALKAVPFTGVMAGSYDSYYMAKNRFENIRIDYTMNVFNNHSVNFFQEEGVETITLSQELNRHEMKRLRPSNSEILLYGYLLLMTSNHCVSKSLGQPCGTKQLALKDRKGSYFKVHTSCPLCVNHIYNSVKTILLDKYKEIYKMGYYQFRLDFIEEDSKTIKQVMDYTKDIRGKQDIKIDEITKHTHLKDFTRGHFLRGIK